MTSKDKALLLTLAILLLPGAAQAQISSNTWGQGGIRVGDAPATTCNFAAEGALKYNSTTKLFQFCNASSWANVGGALGIDGLTDAVYDTTVDYNMVLGSNTAPISGAQHNLWIGQNAGHSTTNAAIQNTAVGFSALTVNTTGDSNVAIGYVAMNSNTTGTENTAIGRNALNVNTTGSDNVAIGTSSINGSSSSNNSVAIGAYSLASNTPGGDTAVGSNTLQLSTGGNNTALGYSAGTSGTSITTGTNDTFIGNSAQASNATLNNATALGYNASVGASNSIRLGNTSVTAVTTSGQLFSQTIITTESGANSITLTAAEMVGGVIIATSNTAGNWTTATAANIIAAIPNVDTSANGTAFYLKIINKSGAIKTMTANTGVTLVNTAATMATAFTTEYLVQVTGASTVTMTKLGTLAAP